MAILQCSGEQLVGSCKTSLTKTIPMGGWGGGRIHMVMRGQFRRQERTVEKEGAMIHTEHFGETIGISQEGLISPLVRMRAYGEDN